MKNELLFLEKLKQKKQKIKQRNSIIRSIRSYFYQKNFLEVETPIFSTKTCCEPYIDFFETEVITDKNRKIEGFLVPSPEIHLKKLVGAGYGNIFEITRVFRNKENIKSPYHNMEFSMIEWYREGETYESIMEDIRELFLHIGKSVYGKSSITYNGVSYNLEKIRKITVSECFKKYANIDLEKMENFEELNEIAQKRGYGHFKEKDDSFYALFLNEIEEHLGKGNIDIIYEYPSFQSAFSKLKETDTRFSNRFEVYAGGMELGNAYDEQCSPEKVKQQIEDFNCLNMQTKGKTFSEDEEYIYCLSNIKQLSGIAMGIDRMIMFFTNSLNIEEILTFPMDEK